MLIEHRAYTLRPGNREVFLRAQVERGFDLVRPILERLIGYFLTASGPDVQVVHLYRFDDYEDWVRRLHGLYHVSALEPYFRTVRPLMLAQENRFLAPAPVAELTPLWGNGRDWLPDSGRLFADLARAPDCIVEEATLTLLPGSLPAYWQAAREHGVPGGGAEAAHLMGCFVSLVGRQHQVIQYRAFNDFAARKAYQQKLGRSDAWQSFLRAVAPLTASSDVKLLEPVPIAPMSPLFMRA